MKSIVEFVDGQTISAGVNTFTIISMQIGLFYNSGITIFVHPHDLFLVSDKRFLVLNKNISVHPHAWETSLEITGVP